MKIIPIYYVKTFFIYYNIMPVIKVVFYNLINFTIKKALAK